MIIYTSGTTGRPKGAVHVHGGFPIKGAQDLAHQFDLRPGDTLFWFTDLGWMMGPWAISGALLLGARLVLYEGAPDFPGPDRLWSIVARHRRHPPRPLADGHPGADGARRGAGPRATTGRRCACSARPASRGTPIRGGGSSAVVGDGRCPIVNYSGGTEVSGGIVGGNVLGPIKPASFSGPCIGTAADVVDEAGQPGARRGRRAGHPGADAGHDPRLLARRRGRYEATYWARLPGDVGPRRLGQRSTRTASGTSTAAPTTRSRSPASGSGRPRSRAPRSRTRRSSRRRRSASRTRSRARWSSCSCVLRPGETRRPGAPGGDRPATVAGQLGKPLKPERVGGRPGAAQDPLGQGHAAGDPGGLARARPGRPVGARRSARRSRRSAGRSPAAVALEPP